MPIRTSADRLTVNDRGCLVGSVASGPCVARLQAGCGPQSVPLCLQNTPGLSGAVVHLGLSLVRVRWDRPVSGPAVVSLGGRRLGRDLLIRRLCHAHPLPAYYLLTWRDATHWCVVGGDVERRCAAKKRPMQPGHEVG